MGVRSLGRGPLCSHGKPCPVARSAAQHGPPPLASPRVASASHLPFRAETGRALCLTLAHVHTHAGTRAPSPAPKPPRARCPALLETSWERRSPSTQKQVSVTTQTCWGANTPSHAPRLTWKPLSAAGFQQKIISLMKTEKLKGNPEVILRPGFKANPLVVVGFGFSAQPGCKEEPRGSH